MAMQFQSVSLSVTVQQSAATGAAPAGRPHHMLSGKALEAAADKLGMSADDLQQALQSGQQLGDLAKAKGVSMDDLRQAIRTARQSDAAASTNGTQAAAGASDPDGDGDGGAGAVQGHHHHHHGGGAALDSKVLGVIADKLGETSDQLKQQLQSGQQLGDLVKAKGLTSDDIKSAIEQAFSNWQQYGQNGATQTAAPTPPAQVDTQA